MSMVGKGKRHELRELTRGRRKEITDHLVGVVHDYRHGRAATACMADLERFIRKDIDDAPRLALRSDTRRTPDQTDHR